MPIPLIAFGVLAIIGAGVTAIGISNIPKSNSDSKPNSKAAPSSNIFDEIAETQDSIEQKVKTQLFLGTVTILLNIASNEENERQQHEEMMETISGISAASGALAVALTAVTMNGIQDAIAESQKEQGQEIGSTTSQTTAASENTVSETVAVDNQGPTILVTPEVEQQPTIYVTPGIQQEPTILTFPRVEQEPAILVFPDDNPAKPTIYVTPKVETKGLGDSILWMGGNEGVGKTKYDNIDINNLKESNPVELDNIINDIGENGGSPLDIPENATINAKSMNKGYQQIKYNWSDGTYKYESRWHTETPGAVKYDRGTTWVVTRTIPGNAQGQMRVTEYLVGDNWINEDIWNAAERANMAGKATQEQMDLLEAGHWLAK